MRILIFLTMITNKAILFFLLAMFTHVSFSSDYSDTPTTGNEKNWRWAENRAYQRFNNGTYLTVTFLPNYQCNYANFGIISNDEINSISLNIDDSKYSNVSPKNTVQQDKSIFAEFTLSKSALRELKNGSHLKIDLDAGTISSRLNGSAKSFNMAYGNCMKAIPENAGRKIQQAPSIKNVQVQRPRSAYAQRLDEQYSLSREKMARQRAADLANRRAAYAKRKGLSALPGNHGLAREAKNEMAALGLDQTQRNLDRGFDRSMFNDTSNLVNQGLLFEDRASRSDTYRINAITGAKNAEANAARSGLGAAEKGMTEAQSWKSLDDVTSRISDISEVLFEKKKALATYDTDNSGRDTKPDDLIPGKRALQARIDALNAELQNATAQRDMFHQRLGLQIQKAEVADRPKAYDPTKVQRE